MGASQCTVKRNRIDPGSLFSRHAATVSRWASRLIDPPVDVRDVVQDVFLIVHRRHRSFREESRVTTWLYRITRREASRRLRLARTRLRTDCAAGREMRDAAAAIWPDPTETIRRREEAAVVHRILGRLRKSDAEVLRLFEMEDLRGEQIAALMGLTLSAVWVRLHRARRRFRSELARQGVRGIRPGLEHAKGERP